MSLEGLTKDTKDEKQPMGEKRNGGLKWVVENLVLVLVCLHQNQRSMSTLRVKLRGCHNRHKR